MERSVREREVARVAARGFFRDARKSFDLARHASSPTARNRFNAIGREFVDQARAEEDIAERGLPVSSVSANLS